MKQHPSLAPLGLLAALLLGGWTSAAQAQQPPALPPNITTILAKPMIMLNMSKDHLLFARAFNEYSDIDNDGVPDVTYKHSFDYYGYFDSYKCYTYSGTASRFEPHSVTADKYCSGQWSGNFLNWVSMTKADVLRKVLYGGYRSTDTADTTVLERAFLPSDSHSFAKYYTGSDLIKLAPFDANQIAIQRNVGSFAENARHRRYNTGTEKHWIYTTAPGFVVPALAPTGSCEADVIDFYDVADVDDAATIPAEFKCIWFDTNNTIGLFPVSVGDQVRALDNGSSTRISGTVIRVGSGGRFGMLVTPASFENPSNNNSQNWRFENLTQTSVTICNTTPNATNETPRMRVARGNHQLWAANERWQCYWSQEKGASNGNVVGITGLGASTGNPNRDTQGVTVGGAGPDFVVRVQACVASLLGKERCRQYPNGNYKPIGLLHEYGENDQAEFGLLTGSWSRNVSGGVLRSNMRSFTSEVNLATDGTFTSDANIVRTLNNMRIRGYRYSDGTYIGDGGSGTGAGTSCSFQQSDDVRDDNCTDWGNPMGEMFVESLRYLAGLAPTAAFSNFTYTGSKDASLNMPKPTWVDPMLRANATERAAVEAKFGPAQCRPINMVNFNSSVVSFDHDQIQTAFTGLPASQTVAALVDIVGAGEGINGSDWFAGTTAASNNRLCTSKLVGGLSSVEGLCPDAPAFRGTFGIAGAAHWAYMNAIRTDIGTGGNPEAFKVKTYSVALSTNKPRIRIVHDGKVIELQPSYINNANPAAPGSGTLIDFRILEETATSGRYLVIWEDSQRGGDYDQDHAGILRWEIVGGQLRVYTSNYYESTSTQQGFGYTISGSNKDGAHFHTGIEGFTFNDPTNLTVFRTNGTASANTNASGGCQNCQVGQPETYAVYDFVGSAAGVLPDPLLLAAKWGGFDKSGGLTAPTTQASWDSKKLDGTAGTDGIPDNYFFAIRPDELENSLRAVFQDVIASSNTAPAVASAQLTDGSLKYVVSFDGNDGHGELDAFAIQTNGLFSTTAKWKAHERLTATPPGSRVIITNQVDATGASLGGTALRWASLTAETRAAAFGTDANAEKRLNWMRGSRADEAPFGAGLRARNALSIMGSVVNSNPHVQRPPRAPFFGGAFPGYGDFVLAQKDRPPIIWLSSNDGMLHGFNASDNATLGGTPVLSYLPQPLHSNLQAWINPSDTPVVALADGSPFTADVMVNDATNPWRTYLFSSLGRGAPGFFALDVTDTGKINPATGALIDSGDMSESNASTIFRWQFTAADDTSGDLGYNIEQANTASRFTGQAASVAKMNNGKFAVMFGNGVNSPNNSSALYILFVDGPSSTGWSTAGAGASYVKLTAVDSADNTSLPNGLSQPTWVDKTGDGIADAIYAGDLRGNLWKFDVSSNNIANWKVAYSVAVGDTKPLYKAALVDTGGISRPQPITTAPQFTLHPQGGYLITFATGKAVSSVDFPDPFTRPHTLYGVWDKPSLSTQTGTDLAAALPRGLSKLLPRTFNRLADGSGAGYVTGAELIDWSTKDGWYMNFPSSSEMVVSNIVVNSLRLLSVVSLAPKNNLGECSSAPDAYITFLSPLTGLLNFNVLGTYIDSSSNRFLLSSTKLVDGDQLVTLAIDRTQKEPVAGSGGSGGAAGGAGNTCFRVVGASTDLKACSAALDRRIQWREIFNFRTR